MNADHCFGVAEGVDHVTVIFFAPCHFLLQDLNVYTGSGRKNCAFFYIKKL
jgi:hypothetical protein